MVVGGFCQKVCQHELATGSLRVEGGTILDDARVKTGRLHVGGHGGWAGCSMPRSFCENDEYDDGRGIKIDEVSGLHCEER